MGTDCSSNPCQDGGTCEDHDGTFTCFCSEKRSGRFCQTPVYSPKLHIPSFSGGGHVLFSKIDKLINSFQITNKQKHDHKHVGQSYIELQTMRHVEHKTSIYIEFKTLRNDRQICNISSKKDWRVEEISFHWP